MNKVSADSTYSTRNAELVLPGRSLVSLVWTFRGIFASRQIQLQAVFCLHSAAFRPNYIANCNLLEYSNHYIRWIKLIKLIEYEDSAFTKLVFDFKGFLDSNPSPYRPIL
jgi:hypothetical protein